MRKILREGLVSIEFVLVDLGDIIHKFHIKVKEFRWDYFED